MAIAQGFTATAMFAGLALGLAAPALATNQMSGHYIVNQTTLRGFSHTEDWYFTPCGDGCASLADSFGVTLGQAHLVNGQWTMDGVNTGATCSDGSIAPPGSTSTHYIWDPNTLAGEVQITNYVSVCGNPAGPADADNIQFRQAA